MKTNPGTSLAFFIFGLLLTAATVCAKDPGLPLSKFPPARDAEWCYVEPIRALKEKSLMDYPPGVDVYRFIFCPSFSSGLMARIVKDGSKVTFTGVQFGGEAGFAMQSIANRESRSLGKTEWNSFRGIFDASDFFGMSHYIERGGVDGYTSVLEARVGGRYHYAVRWVPADYPEDKAFAAMEVWFVQRIKRVGTVETEDGTGLKTGNGTAVILK